MSTPRTDWDQPVSGAPDFHVVIAVVAGIVGGALLGFLVGDARTFGAVGAMAGLVAGLALPVLSPQHRERPATPGRQPRRR